MSLYCCLCWFFYVESWLLQVWGCSWANIWSITNSGSAMADKPYAYGVGPYTYEGAFPRAYVSGTRPVLWPSLVSSDTCMIHVWDVGEYAYGWVLHVGEKDVEQLCIAPCQYAYKKVSTRMVHVWEKAYAYGQKLVFTLLRMFWPRNMVIRVWGCVIRVWAYSSRLWCILVRFVSFGQPFELLMILMNSSEWVYYCGLCRSVFWGLFGCYMMCVLYVGDELYCCTFQWECGNSREELQWAGGSRVWPRWVVLMLIVLILSCAFVCHASFVSCGDDLGGNPWWVSSLVWAPVESLWDKSVVRMEC